MLHLLLITPWKSPLRFDLAGQQSNQQMIEISLRSPEPVETPSPQKSTPVEKTEPPEPAADAEPIPAPTPPWADLPEKNAPEVPTTATTPPPPEKIEAVTQPPPPQSKTESIVAAPPVEPRSVEPKKTPRKQYVPFQADKLAHKQMIQTAAPPATPPTTEVPIEKPETKAEPDTPPPPEVAEVKPPAADPKPIPTTRTPEKTAVADPEPPSKPAEPTSPTASQASAETAQTESEESIKQSQSMIRRLVQAELVRHFQYPRLARRRGWEGKVVIDFTVEPDGSLSQIQVLQHSKHRVLNESALKTMQQIRQLSQITPGSITRPVRMEIPIIYRLNNR